MTRAIRLLTLLAGCGLALGCGGRVDDTTGSGGDGGAGGDGGSGGSPTSSSSPTTTTTGPEPGATTLKAQASLVTIQPGEEAVKCITVGLGNAAPVLVRKFRTSLNQGSHHMIVYQSDQPPDPTPFTCQSFGVQGGSAIFIAQQAQSELALPIDASGVPVALPLAANQSVTIEIHYINATSAPIDVIGTLELDVLPASAEHIPSAFNFMGALGIPEIPAFGEADTGVQFQDAIPGTKVFALTTHQHHLGTRMRVWHAANVADLSTPIADSTDWSDPPLELFDPPLDFPADSSKGFAYQCEWKNPTAQPVYGGLGADDEMCFFWSYYYPAGGAL